MANAIGAAAAPEIDITEALRRVVTYRDRDITLFGPPGDSYVAGVTLAGSSNAPIDWFLRSVVRKDSYVADVGANVGLTSVLFSRHTNGRIYSFEPAPRMFPYLEATLRANDADEAYAYNLAIGREPGTLQFLQNEQAVAASHLVTDASLKGASDKLIDVKVATIDGLVEDGTIEKIDVMKLDVEGFELDVLAGAKKAIDTFKPTILLEINAFTLVAFRNLNPRTVVEELLDTFPHVYSFVNGMPREVGKQQPLVSFLHRLLVSKGCVEDLVCSFKPLK